MFHLSTFKLVTCTVCCIIPSHRRGRGCQYQLEGPWSRGSNVPAQHIVGHIQDFCQHREQLSLSNISRGPCNILPAAGPSTVSKEKEAVSSEDLPVNLPFSQPENREFSGFVLTACSSCDFELPPLVLSHLRCNRVHI